LTVVVSLRASGHPPTLWWIRVPTAGHPVSTFRICVAPTTHSAYSQPSARTANTSSIGIGIRTLGSAGIAAPIVGRTCCRAGTSPYGSYVARRSTRPPARESRRDRGARSAGVPVGDHRAVVLDRDPVGELIGRA